MNYGKLSPLFWRALLRLITLKTLSFSTFCLCMNTVSSWLRGSQRNPENVFTSPSCFVANDGGEEPGRGAELPPNVSPLCSQGTQWPEVSTEQDPRSAHAQTRTHTRTQSGKLPTFQHLTRVLELQVRQNTLWRDTFEAKGVCVCVVLPSAGQWALV